MPLSIASDGRLIYFAHVPKAGGSSVEDHLEARFGPLSMIDRNWERVWHNGLWRESSITGSPQHLTASDAARLLPARIDWTFAMVRDPVARLVSEYRFQARMNRGRRRLTGAGFSTWLRISLSGARWAPMIFDNHLRPQTEIVPEGAEVFRLEDGFAPLLTRLDALFGPPPPGTKMGRALESRNHAQVVPSAQDLTLIARVYAADYARFGYPPPDIDGAPCDRLAPMRDAAGAGLGPVAVAIWRRGRL